MGGVRRGGLRIEVGVARFDAGTSVFVDSRLASGCDGGRIGGHLAPCYLRLRIHSLVHGSAQRFLAPCRGEVDNSASTSAWTWGVACSLGAALLR